MYFFVTGCICLIPWVVIFWFFFSSCQVPEKLKEDPALYKEAQKSREHNIHEIGKVYRNQSGKVIRKVEEKIEESLN